ncbi:restriction endonuclease fold toxin-2 domain-containing protein [Streptomyces sp. NPDC059916]|uniref:restriction endonuclease fold toxin-2 domain-containing protein n=1 Tax=Streptomyces sp. NPDC059916 TaxID=3347001 RepID=UPI0036BB76D5
MGMPADLQLISSGMIKASMMMVKHVMPGLRSATIALFHELARQKGMAGDDDAGHEFAKVYKSAASTTLDKMGFSTLVMSETGRGLMHTAREFLAKESEIASKILGKQVDLTDSMGDPYEDCEESFLGRGQELEEVIGETSAWDQYAPGGMSDRFRGSPEKLRDVAGSWRAGGKLMLRILEDAQACAHTADKAHSGEAADSFRKYFAGFVGFASPPDNAQHDEALVANLVAACHQLAKACDRYADHVDDAKLKIQQHKLDLFHVDAPWDSPMFGGNGDDGGLKDAVLNDPWIHRLGDVAHALDSAEKRVKLPRGSDSRPGLPFSPFIPLPVPAPVPLVLASYNSGAPGIVPAVYRPTDPNVGWVPPIPPTPGTTQLLSVGERNQFTSFVNGLPPHGFAGAGTDPTIPENAYQLRTAGYPERKISLPSGSRKGAIAADGMRPADGYMIDAKYVKDKDSKNCWRKPETLDNLEDTYNAQGKKQWNREKIFKEKDDDELVDYRDAMKEHKEIHGLEIVTNDQDSASYWQTLLADNQVKGTARYVP